MSCPDPGAFGCIDPGWSQPYCRLRALILQSLPVRHFTVRRNAGRCSTDRLAVEGLPFGGWFGPLVEPFVIRAIRRSFKADLARLKKILEADAAAARADIQLAP